MEDMFKLIDSYDKAIEYYGENGTNPENFSDEELIVVREKLSETKGLIDRYRPMVNSLRNYAKGMDKCLTGLKSVGLCKDAVNPMQSVIDHDIIKKNAEERELIAGMLNHATIGQDADTDLTPDEYEEKKMDDIKTECRKLASATTEDEKDELTGNLMAMALRMATSKIRSGGNDELADRIGEMEAHIK